MVRLTRNQAREIDRRSIEEYHIPGIVLMENAARAVATSAMEMLDGNSEKRILIVAGGGNNGGDALAAARHLHNAGANIHIALTVDPRKYHGDALINWQIVQAMKLPTSSTTLDALQHLPADLILDGIFGTGLSSPPRAPFAEQVAVLQGRSVPILAIDLPSGLDCDTGQPLCHCLKATRTITFVTEKIGFASSAAWPYLGQVQIADIGCPIELIAEIASE